MSSGDVLMMSYSFGVKPTCMHPCIRAAVLAQSMFADVSMLTILTWRLIATANAYHDILLQLPWHTPTSSLPGYGLL